MEDQQKITEDGYMTMKESRFCVRGREVAYKRINGLSPLRQTHDRFWSCEIDFDPVLDHRFSVKNIKVGAKPISELAEKLSKVLSPKIALFC